MAVYKLYRRGANRPYDHGKCNVNSVENMCIKNLYYLSIFMSVSIVILSFSYILLIIRK